MSAASDNESRSRPAPRRDRSALREPPIEVDLRPAVERAEAHRAVAAQRVAAEPAAGPARDEHMTISSRESARAGRRRMLWPLIGLLALAVFIVIRIASPLQDVTLGDALSDWVTLSLSVLVESTPFVVLGIIIAIALRFWLPQGLLLDHLPSNGFTRRIIISLFGILLPVCECGNVPVTRGFLSRGMNIGDALTFLVAAPIVNPVTIITTYQAFGWQNGVLVGRVAGALVLANLVGWLFSLYPEQRRLLTSAFDEACRLDAHEHAGGGFVGRLRSSGGVFRTETQAMLVALIGGAFIAGAIQVFVPRHVLVDLGADPVWGVVALMLLAFIVSICSNVDAFFILALGSTFLPGALVGFLVFGAIIDIKMLALLRTTFSTRTLIWLTVIVALFVLVLGSGMNALA
ncbi:permease [Pseudoclavibacter sp. CFCC 11306]|uniref:permease n=1 Tax=Pseudoclavibacter sp. CFCC 11306 TaxID=1564493 RepID=UPI001CE49EC8|nr:permease [Pseudoclavibacter sp. CFCC 11306]